MYSHELNVYTTHSPFTLSHILRGTKHLCKTQIRERTCIYKSLTVIQHPPCKGSRTFFYRFNCGFAESAWFMKREIDVWQMCVLYNINCEFVHIQRYSMNIYPSIFSLLKAFLSAFSLHSNSVYFLFFSSF